MKYGHKPKRVGGYRVFMVSFCITVLLFVGGASAVAALARMEDRMNSGEYVLFSFEKEGEKSFGVTALGEEYLLDLSAVEDLREAGRELQLILPPELRLFEKTANFFVDQISVWIKNLIS